MYSPRSRFNRPNNVAPGVPLRDASRTRNDRITLRLYMICIVLGFVTMTTRDGDGVARFVAGGCALLLRLLVVVLPVLFFQDNVSASSFTGNDYDVYDHGTAVLEWLQTTISSNHNHNHNHPHYYVHPSLELRFQHDPQPPSYGMFATDDIEQFAVLIQIPISLTLQGMEEEYQVGDRVIVPVEVMKEKDENGEDEEDSDDDESTNIGYEFATVMQVKEHSVVVLINNNEDEQQQQPSMMVEYNVDDIDPVGSCLLARRVLDEMAHLHSSPYAPYLKLLQSQSLTLPSAWSINGKDLLAQVQGDLPPVELVGWSDDWKHLCHGTEHDLPVYLTTVQRQWLDDRLIPVIDFLNHRNGLWLNTMIETATTTTTTNNDDDTTATLIVVRASRDIAADEEIYATYNQCLGCDERFDSYGTPELLRDYGFVEDFPQRWVFHEYGIGFDLDETEDDELFVEWMEEYEEPDITALEFLRRELHRLEQLETTVFRERDPDVPEQEWNVIKKFADSAILAIKTAIDYRLFDGEDCEGGVCKISPDSIGRQTRKVKYKY